MESLKNWLILLLLALVWGSSFILMKRGLFAPDGSALFSGIQVGALRIVVATLVMLPFAIKQRRLLKNGKFRFFFLVGCCGNAIPAFLFAGAQTEIPSALAGMLNSTVPIFSLAIAYFVFKVDMGRYQLAGLILGSISTIGLLFTSGQMLGREVNLGYAFLVLIATFCYAVSLNVIKQFLQKEPPIAITALALLLVSPAGAAVLVSTDFSSHFVNNNFAWNGFLAITILAIFGTALALILFNKLVQDTNTVFASSVTYVIPLVAILWGLADGETLSYHQVFFAAMMLVGIILINRKKKQSFVTHQ